MAGFHFIILAQAAIEPEPGKCPFYHPAARQHGKPFLIVRLFYDFKHPIGKVLDPGNQLPTITPVRPEVLQAGERAFEPRKQEFGSVAILNTGRRDDNNQEQSQCIYRNMPFATFH